MKVEKVETITDFGAAWSAGVRMIPALVEGDRKLQGVLLSERRIRDFIASSHRVG